MSKSAFSLIFVLVLVGIASAQKLPPPQGMKSGFYKLSLYGDDWQGRKDVIVLLRRKGDSLEMIDALTKSKYKTKVVTYKIWGIQETSLQTASFDLGDSKSTLSPASRINFAASKYGSLMVTWENENRQAPAEIRSLTVLWFCGNHQNPTHTAESPSEMNQKTGRYGCKDWYQLKESDIK